MNTVWKAAGLASALMLAVPAAQAQGPAAGFDWTGGYAGLHAGWLSASAAYNEPDFGGTSIRPDPDGFAGGALAGYNRRVGGYVLGLELDGGLADAGLTSDNPVGNDYTAFDLDWTAHLRARLGLPLERTLVYLAGGLAIAQLTVDDIDPGFGEADSIHLGWTAGGGVEHAVGGGLVLRLEYLYADYGEASYTIASPPGPYFPSYAADVDLSAHMLRAAASWHF